ncbi:MAG: hypothetical protein NTX25_01840 [Proteobacteria bacterium]|nr:hypothetical protein [Pseudomonadota bacterium]
MRLAPLCFGMIVLMSSGCILQGPAIVNENQPELDASRQIIDVGDYSDASWDYFGFYDGSGKFEHQYGGKGAGYYEYKFRGSAETPLGLRIAARLSAESNEKGKPDEISDVTLSINGVELTTQTVGPDDMEGAIFTWQLSDKETLHKLKLKPAQENTLRLSVKPDAKHKNGLCLYGQALQNAAGAKPVTIEILN